MTYKHGLMLCSAELSPEAWVDLTPPAQMSDAPASTKPAVVQAVFGVAQDVFAADIRALSWTLWRIPPSTEAPGPGAG